MPQEFRVLRCFSCHIFQVHIVKRSSNKWVCKMCGTRQSLQKVYGSGSAVDCRKYVQECNMRSITSQSAYEEKVVGSVQTLPCDEKEPSSEAALSASPSVSKWTAFLPDEKCSPNDSPETDNSNQPPDEEQYVLSSSNISQEEHHASSLRPRKNKNPPCQAPVTTSKWARFTE